MAIYLDKVYKKHFQNLDGLRFAASLTVAICHFEVLKSQNGLRSINSRFLDNSAQLAVTFFFVLSGFLITWWFLKDTKGDFGKIDLKGFYTTRIARTWPLYYLIVIVCFLLLGEGAQNSNSHLGSRLLFYLLFMPNLAEFKFGNIVYLGQTWSLAVEEFFYLIFPIFLFATEKEKIIRNTVYLTAFLFVISAFVNPVFINSILHIQINNSSFILAIKYIERYRIYSFLLGAITAMLYYKGKLWQPFIKNYQLLFKTFSILVVLTTCIFFIFGITFSFLTHQVYSILFSCLLFVLILNQKKYWLLDNGFSVSVGKRSYGIYMLHIFMAVLTLKVFNCLGLKDVNYFKSAFFIGLTLLISHISFTYIERPIIMMVKNKNKWR